VEFFKGYALIGNFSIPFKNSLYVFSFPFLIPLRNKIFLNLSASFSNIVACYIPSLTVISCLLQMLLRPIVSQLVVDPPVLLNDSMNILSVKEVDDLLVVCIGQMAVTAGSDLLWKPLNHEVNFMISILFYCSLMIGQVI